MGGRGAIRVKVEWWLGVCGLETGLGGVGIVVHGAEEGAEVDAFVLRHGLGWERAELVIQRDVARKPSSLMASCLDSHLAH